ncbi:vasoactive intestinal polypeptide receptor 1 isoform X3 [Hyperolius riggenbachi]|uniref:vasoactive intestinal polypeptide receptor 1 isoform X3 n=1 Tax=Hyperolius riggenbachi TaxID=752182 RepID=UPI0035A36480
MGSILTLLCLLGLFCSIRCITEECSIILTIERKHAECVTHADYFNDSAVCKRTWDNITCWPSASEGEVVVLQCPEYFYLFNKKGDLADGVLWNDKDRIHDRTQFIADLPHCSHDHPLSLQVGCKAAMVFFQYCIMANFFWLLVEGLYLHTLLVISFFSEKKYFWWYILIGWGAPTVFIMAWTLARIYHDDAGCWDTIESSLWWIIKTPILVSILVNFILFICIIRILVQKLHSPDVGRNENSQYTRLAKSTLLLIPLFGVHYIMFAFFPDNFKVEVKLVFELILGSFQGFVVAILYCFLNGEVQGELKRKWRRWHMERFMGKDTKYHHPSLGSNGTNFSTQISMLTKCSPKTRRCSSFQAEFSLV